MAQLGHDLGFAAETRERLPVVGQLRQQELHREAAGQARVRGLVDLAHSAAADQPQQAIGASQKVAVRWLRRPFE